MNTAQDQTVRRLPGYFFFIRFIGLLTLILFWLIASILPVQYISFFHNPELVLWVLFGFFIFSAAVFYVYEITHNRIFDHVIDLTWSLFFFFIIWQSGGVTSAFLILLVFPLFAASIDLSSERILLYGTLNTLGLAALLLFQPEYWHAPSVIMMHVLQVIFLTIITSYSYKLVNETLRQKYAKQEAAKKYFQLAEIDQVKSDFIMVVSHQLRSPLTGARYALQLIKETPDQKSRDQLITQVTERVNASLDTVNEMLKSLELGPGSMRNNWAVVLLGPLLAEVNEDLRYDREKGGTQVTFHVDGELPVFGDRNLLKAAFAYVLENAVRYAPGGHVAVTATKDANLIRITVRDNGIGISPNDQPHIFDRFFRAKNAMHLYPNESGIGLFTARQILDRHVGSIELVSSELGKGTTMRITLPLHK